MLPPHSYELHIDQNMIIFSTSRSIAFENFIKKIHPH